jgi:hypothetical protein
VVLAVAAVLLMLVVEDKVEVPAHLGKVMQVVVVQLEFHQFLLKLLAVAAVGKVVLVVPGLILMVVLAVLDLIGSR